jgi:hypothetical protein
MRANPDLQTSTFQAEATSALAAVRGSLSALITATGQDLLRPIDLQKSLQIDSKLSWQVFNIINETDPLAAAKLVPGQPSLKRLLQAAQSNGASRATADGVRKAIEAFNSVVQSHAEDRVEFDIMASSIASSAVAASAELGIRRTAYRAESHIWGQCTDIIASTSIVRLNPSGTTTDECTLVNKRTCRRLRPDAPRSVFAYRNYGASGTVAQRFRLPLDARSAERYGAHILPQFCSQPIPTFKTWQRPDGYYAVDVQSDEIGHRSAVSLTFGHIFRNCPLASGLHGEPTYHADMRLIAPARLAICFLLLHKPTLGKATTSLHTFRSSPGDENPAVALSVQQINTRESITYQGIGRKAWHSPDLESHPDMVQSAMDELGWNPAEFDTYCIRIEYPILHSVIRIQFPLQ